MAVMAKAVGSLRRAALALAASAFVCLLAPAFAQSATIPVEGVPSSLRDDLDGLLEQEDAPDSLFAARRQAQRAADTIARLLESEGYFAAEVDPWAEGVEQFSRGVDVEIGPLFVIGDTAIAYSGDSPDEETRNAIEEWLGLIPIGVPARAQPILDVSDEMQRTLENSGYADAAIEPVDAVADGTQHTLDLTFRINAGPRITYDDLDIAGLDRTRREFIHNLRPWRAGDPVSQEQLDEFRTRLSSTGLFSRATVALEEAPQETSRDVVVTLTEGPRRTIALGGSASTSEGLGADAEWETRNVTGRADSITVAARAATLERRLRLSYDRPHVGQYDRNLELAAELEDFETDAFDQTGASLSARLDQQLTRRVRGEIGVEFAYASIEDARTRALSLDRRELYLLAVPVAAEYTGVRDILDPVNGVRARLFVEPGVTYGDDTIGFTRVVGEASAYRELGSNKLVGAVRGRVGAIVGPAGLPPDRLFYAGGGGSVRGYEYQSLSPRDANGEIIGGRSLVEASAELRYRSSDTLGYVAFVDAGAASESAEPSFDNTKAGAGLGVRYYAGFGPLRADIAVPLDKGPGDADFQIYISIGQAF